MPTSDFAAGDVVRVPFPYADRDTRQHRPALVVSDGAVGDRGHLLWVLMITSAENRAWPGDVPLGSDHRAVGLPAPSVVRTCKIATIEIARADPLGRISAAAMTEVVARLKAHLGNRTPD